MAVLPLKVGLIILRSQSAAHGTVKAICNSRYLLDFVMVCPSGCDLLIGSLQTPIPCNGWSLLEYPHLRLQVPLAHTLLQCKIHCEEIKKKKKDRWKTCSKRVICRKSHAMHLSRKSSINDEWCAASEQGRNVTRPGSNGTVRGNQAVPCNHLL